MLQLIHRLCSPFCVPSLSALHLQLVHSQFHLHGPRHFPKTKQLFKQQTDQFYEVEALINALADSRQRCIQEDELMYEDGKEWKGYLKLYGRLCERLMELGKGNWGYKMAGWFNLQQMKDNMVEEMLLERKKR